MNFSWSADWEKRACASPDGEAAPVPQEAVESMILVSGPRVVMSELRQGYCRADESVLFINAGSSAIEGCDPSAKFSGDSFFEGGDAIETSENIVEGGDYPSLYCSAHYGNFSYKFDGLAPGDYFLDLHFAEIVNTCGPKGMRSFDVLVQEEKILSGLDVYAVVGGNRPLQVLDIRVTIESNGAIMIDFKGVRGSPMVCGICIRKAPVLAARSATTGNVLCKKCSADIEVSPIQDENALRTKFLVEMLKYKDNESKDNIPEDIQELIRRVRI